MRLSHHSVFPVLRRLRWCEFSVDYGLQSFHDRHARNKMHHYDLADAKVEVVDVDRLLFDLKFKHRTLHMQAPNRTILDSVTVMVTRIAELREDAGPSKALEVDTGDETVSPMMNDKAAKDSG